MEHNNSVGSADGQEEWLSEEVLTDDDYNPVSQTLQDQELAVEQTSQSSQDGSQPSTTTYMEMEQLDDTGNNLQQYGHDQAVPPEGTETDHQALDHEGTVSPGGTAPLEGTDSGDNGQVVYQIVQVGDGQGIAGDQPEALTLSQLEDDIGMFLIRKSSGAGAGGEERAGAESPGRGDAQEEDGNNTDDLLSMLGEDSAPARTHTQTRTHTQARTYTQARIHSQAADAHKSDDDENEFRNATVTTLKVAKSARLTKLPAKQVKTEESDNDMNATATTLKVAKSARLTKLPAKEVKTEESDSDMNATATTLKVAKSARLTKLPAKEVKTEESDSDMNATATTLKVAKSARLTKLPAQQVKTEESDSDMNATATTLKVAKSARLTKLPAKQVKTEESDSDMSSDEASMVTRMVRLSRKRTAPVAQASAAAPTDANRRVSLLKTSQATKSFAGRGTMQNSSLSKTGVQTKPLLSNVTIKTVPAPKYSSTPLKQYINKNMDVSKQATPAVKQTTTNETQTQQKPFASQRLVRPEQMDEEAPTDEDSNMTEDNFRDELPTSDSEDIDDWFALDIRAERAGDYIPLLGHKACALLTDEKQRVSTKLHSLRSSLATLSAQSRAQTQSIDDARRSLAELDAQLMHA